MKIKYQFATETVEIEVSENWGNVIVDLDRQEYNNNHAETRRHCSLEALNLDDALLPANVDILRDMIAAEERDKLYAAIAQLTPRQRHLIEEIYFKGKTYQQVAREDGNGVTSIWDATNRAIKRLKKLLK